MNDTHDTAPTPEEEQAALKENRKRILRFVGIFAVTTLALLTSYRFAIHTRLNDWYLFQAANHTTWALDVIGSASLEPPHYGRHDVREVRANMAAWADGREKASPEEVAAASGSPLNAWERWSYRALEMRQGGPPRMNGPRVYFVLRPGISTEIDDVVGRINLIEEDADMDAAARQVQLAPLRDELEALRKRQQAAREGEEESEDEARTFPFILIPECGAIEIMAIFLAAVLAFPTAWSKRLIGVVAGVPVMYCVNILRLTVLAVIGAMDKSRVWFNFAHEYVWQAVYIIFVVAVWLLWVEYVVKRNQS